MARTIYGAELIGSPTNETNLSYGVIGKNSTVFTYGDIVYTDVTNGLQQIGTAFTVANPAVLGVIAKTQTMSATNETVAKVEPAFIPIDQKSQFLMGTNSDLSGLTSPGTYYKLTSTGVTNYQVDVGTGATTAASAVVICLGVDPLNEGGSGSGSGLRQGVFQFVHVMNFVN